VHIVCYNVKPVDWYNALHIQLQSRTFMYDMLMRDRTVLLTVHTFIHQLLDPSLPEEFIVIYVL